MHHVTIRAENELEPFLYWTRFEFGENGNPHAHGLCYVSGNPYFDTVIRGELQRENLRKLGRSDADLYDTWEQAESKMAAFYNDYGTEMHPAKDANGEALYDYVIENLNACADSDNSFLSKPQCFNLTQELDRIFQAEEHGKSPDITRLQKNLVALIESGQRHTLHQHRQPILGKDPCARKSKRTQNNPVRVFCRYLFPRELFNPEEGILGHVLEDPYRPDLRNLFLRRNDELLNNFEAHMLLSNLGNIDWRALINLWSVLDYLTKYASKPGKGSKNLGELFEHVLKAIDDFEVEDGVQDLWRRTIMKFYSKILGDRDYSLSEVMHFGLRLPHTISSFAQTVSASASDWVPLK